MDEDYFSIENQMLRIEEREKLEKSKKSFKQLMKDSAFRITPSWNINPDEINFNHLANDYPTFLKEHNYSNNNDQM